MTTKVGTYTQMADRATLSLTAQIKDWSRFLLLAGQFYKYNFLDQVMIYTQRPGATACAEFDLWTRRMGRRIRRGSKGIVLLRFRDGKTSLRYVFDVADTERRENARDPMPWVYREEYQAAVTSWLEKCFHAPGDAGLDKQLIHLDVQFLEEHWHDFKVNILRAAQGSVLGERGEDDIAVHFRTAMTASLAFLLLARCGFDLDSYFTPEDFACIHEFTTGDTVLALGNAINANASIILYQIEYAIREHDKAAGAKAPAAPPKDMPAPRIEDPAPANQDIRAAAR